jgi:hypothetical protein
LVVFFRKEQDFFPAIHPDDKKKVAIVIIPMSPFDLWIIRLVAASGYGAS